MKRAFMGILATGLLALNGCNTKSTASRESPSEPPKPATVSMEDVKRDAVTSLKTTTTYSQQNIDTLKNDLKGQLVTIDEKIAKLRTRGANLASDAKVKWDLKMSDLDTKREAASAKLAEIENSTALAWSDVEKGAQSAWEDLTKALQNASDEF